MEELKMSIDKYLIQKDDPLLLRFAITGTMERFSNLLEDLSNLAEKEKWSCNGEKIKNSILYSYILKTFDKVAKENKIMITDNEESACFNTGLLTPYGEDIICVFNKSKNYTSGNTNTIYWYLDGFYSDSDWKFLNKFDSTPEVATYFTNDSELLFNANADIKINYTHILDERFEERFPEEIRNMGKENIINSIKGSLDITKKRIKRNHRIVIPLYYKEKITYLLPININNYQAALVVSKVRENQYRANTIFTIEMAYADARLLMKPETAWLII